MLPAYRVERGLEVGVILEVLEALDKAGVASPGDVVVATGKPRYLILSALKLLEELGFVEPIYSRGTHKIYRVSRLGYLLMELGIEGLRKAIEAELIVDKEHGSIGESQETVDSGSREVIESRPSEIPQEA
jgi:DNA-binding transcriptional ArsR family regulator